MTAASAESRTQRARLAHRTRTFGPESPQAQEARRDFAAARLADHVRAVVDKAPPLTDEQRERIAGLLRVSVDRPQAAHADLGITDHQADQIGLGGADDPDPPGRMPASVSGGTTSLSKARSNDFSDPPGYVPRSTSGGITSAEAKSQTAGIGGDH